jgi:hypothetical protein
MVVEATEESVEVVAVLLTMFPDIQQLVTAEAADKV